MRLILALALLVSTFTANAQMLTYQDWWTGGVDGNTYTEVSDGLTTQLEWTSPSTTLWSVSSNLWQEETPAAVVHVSTSTESRLKITFSEPVKDVSFLIYGLERQADGSPGWFKVQGQDIRVTNYFLNLEQVTAAAGYTEYVRDGAASWNMNNVPMAGVTILSPVTEFELIFNAGSYQVSQFAYASAVPEPAAYGLLLLLAVGAYVVWRRR